MHRPGPGLIPALLFDFLSRPSSNSSLSASLDRPQLPPPRSTPPSVFTPQRAVKLLLTPRRYKSDLISELLGTFLRFARVLVSILYSFILLSGLPLSDYDTGYLRILLLMGICFVFSFGLYASFLFLSPGCVPMNGISGKQERHGLTLIRIANQDFLTWSYTPTSERGEFHWLLIFKSAWNF